MWNCCFKGQLNIGTNWKEHNVYGEKANNYTKQYIGHIWSTAYSHGGHTVRKESEHFIIIFPFETVFYTNECKYLTPVEFSKAFQSDNISLSMLYINCRSLKAHWNSLQELFCNLSSDGLKRDIWLITNI